MNMTTSFTLSGEGETTSMAWEADVKIAGPVGSMGQRVLQPIINQQVGNVLAALEERGAGGEGRLTPPCRQSRASSANAATSSTVSARPHSDASVNAFSPSAACAR